MMQGKSFVYLLVSGKELSVTCCLCFYISLCLRIQLFHESMYVKSYVKSRWVRFIEVLDSSATWCTFSPKLKKWKKTPLWNISYIFSKKRFPYSLRKGTFYPRFKNFFYFRRKFSGLKNKINPLWKKVPIFPQKNVFLISGNDTL